MLSDSDILSRLTDGSLKIEGFEESNLTPNGYDVTIGVILVPSTGEKISSGTAVVRGGTRFLIGTKEVISMPPDLAGQIWIRTSWARKGIVSSFGIIDAGFVGNLTFSALNSSQEPVEVRVGERFAQIVFIPLQTPSTKGYSSRSGNYQGQRGITLEPIK